MKVRNTTTGEETPAHLIGTDGEGRNLYATAEGWEPLAEHYACDRDGNIVELRPGETEAEYHVSATAE